MSDPTITQVLNAISALYSNDNKNRREADRWLDAFRNKREAWQVASYLLDQADTRDEVKLFAAQTLKQKITQDLRDLDDTARLSLRTMIIGKIRAYASGLRSVLTQLCVALAGLAIQLTDWKSVIQDLTTEFQNIPNGQLCLLEVIQVLPEEIYRISSLSFPDEVYRKRTDELITDNAVTVIQLLSSMCGASAGNTALQEKILWCLLSWLRDGCLDIRMVLSSPLFVLAFESLENDELFDKAVEVTREIINNTSGRSEITANELVSLIEKVCQRVMTLIDTLKQSIADEDDDKVRGLGLIVIECGEAYVPYIVQEPKQFSFLLDAISQCAAYNELEIVKITLNFWDDLTATLEEEKYRQFIPFFEGYYDNLMDAMIRHFQFPMDTNEWTAQEMDEFRDFRHEMGDMLKHCCRILTSQKCLAKVVNHMNTLLCQPEPPHWQLVEALLFSLRAIGSEVPPTESQFIPLVMQLLSKLPDHPKIRYATTLVISRYSFWSRCHPEYIQYQLSFVCAGFQNKEVADASALALKHLCEDCKEHLVTYLKDLHTLYVPIAGQLPIKEVLDVTTGIAHVMSMVPPVDIVDGLNLFCMPLAKEVEAIISKPVNELQGKDYERIEDVFRIFSIFFKTTQLTIRPGEAHPCVVFAEELWPLFDRTLDILGTDSHVCESVNECFQRLIRSYKQHVKPLMPRMMEKIVTMFSKEGGQHAAYLYTCSRIVGEFAIEGSDSVQPCYQLLELMSARMFNQLQSKALDELADDIVEYFYLVREFIKKAPTTFLQSPLVNPIFDASLACLMTKEVHAVDEIISVYERMLGLCILPPETMPADMAARNSAVTLGVFAKAGDKLIDHLFSGLLHRYHSEQVRDVAGLVENISKVLPTECIMWVGATTHKYAAAPLGKEQYEFMQTWTRAVQEKHWPKVCRVFSDFSIVCRRECRDSYDS